MVPALTTILLAYLTGAIPFGLLVARLFGVRDIRAAGSGNIGATNVGRVLGFKAAAWVYLLDIGKGAAAVWLAGKIDQTMFPTDLFIVLVALAAILGHVFPVYLRFKGGKGVSTATGSLVVLLPPETAIAILVFLAVAFATRYISIASISAAVTLPLVCFVESLWLDRQVAQTYWVLAVLIGVAVPITHHKNIRRLINGTENRFGFSSGSSPGVPGE